MKRFHSFLLLTICVLCGCSDLSETIVAPTVDEQKLSETITPMQALDLLNSTLNSIDGGTKSSSCQLDPNNLIPLGRKNLFSITKSGDSTYDMPDTLLYAINLPEGGYSILNAQRSASTPVFCITDKGEIGVEDFMEALTLINSGRRTKTEINSADDDSFEELV